MLKQGISILFGILLSGLVMAQDVNEIFNDRIEIYFSFETSSKEEVNILSKIIFQYSISVFRTKHDMILAFVNRMC